MRRRALLLAFLRGGAGLPPHLAPATQPPSALSRPAFIHDHATAMGSSLVAPSPQTSNRPKDAANIPPPPRPRPRARAGGGSTSTSNHTTSLQSAAAAMESAINRGHRPQILAALRDMNTHMPLFYRTMGPKNGASSS